MQRLFWPPFWGNDMKKCISVVLVLLIAVLVSAQKRQQDLKGNHYRVIAIDRVISDAKGTRPAHADGKIGFVAIYSPDRKHCVVEYAGSDFHAFDDLRGEVASHADPQMMIFEKSAVSRGVYERIIHSAGYSDVDFDKFYVRLS